MSEQTGGRPAALGHLRKHLDSLTEEARVSWWRLGPFRTALKRRDWPVGAAERALRWQELLELFAAEPKAQLIEVWAEGVPQSRATLFDLPPAQLPIAFAEVTPPASGERGGENEPAAAVSIRLLAAPEEGEGGAPAAGPRVSADCAQDVLRMLFRLQARRTLDALVEEFAASERFYHWSRSSVSAACNHLKNVLGAIDNRRDERGAGYGLLHWTDDPCGE